MSKISRTTNGNLFVPDSLVGLFNKVATQIRFHTISGKNEALTVGDIVTIAQEFFEKEHARKTVALQHEIDNVRAELAVAKTLIGDHVATIKRNSAALRRMNHQRRSLKNTVKRRRKNAR